MEALQGRDVLSLADLNAVEILSVLDFAAQLKAGTVQAYCPQVLGLLFTKASTRTRVSFSVAMSRLGGQVLDLSPGQTQIGRGEPLKDTARVLDRYLDALAVRTFAQADLETIASYSHMPVINALTDREHPCQILADLLTIQEQFGTLAGLTLAYLGDGNNVAHSLLLGCALVGMNVVVATPTDYAPLPEIVAQAGAIAANRSQVKLTQDPQAAVQAAQILYTDVWASMGQEDEAKQRLPIFAPYQINAELLTLADPNAIVLHCLPAHRGEEITTEVLEGTQAQIWNQAENRLHTQQALLASLLGATLR
ncbi:ornithine carbamoyltransferase [Synechococcales cyanobacterium C]|uniref:Ornithine carbamoyltransferase n=1 Tax=Petrachloros mirabilis ULC683 TaxID=2781853 RepID=A0A8K2A6P2_9CYAN|nr:ornithine carbamoyltransferase [Petrachloros mirabilis]NCJ06066.1 ornithine carbamoyltransferase [Petrachloros mirabilis ULC683]